MAFVVEGVDLEILRPEILGAHYAGLAVDAIAKELNARPSWTGVVAGTAGSAMLRAAILKHPIAFTGLPAETRDFLIFAAGGMDLLLPEAVIEIMKLLPAEIAADLDLLLQPSSQSRWEQLDLPGEAQFWHVARAQLDPTIWPQKFKNEAGK